MDALLNLNDDANINYVNMSIFLHLVLISHESGNGKSKFCAVVIFVHLNTQMTKYLWGASPSDYCSAVKSPTETYYTLFSTFNVSQNSHPYQRSRCIQGSYFHRAACSRYDRHSKMF
jgi:hypothetical protein